MQLNLSAIKLDPQSGTPPAIRNWTLGQLLDATVIGRDGENSIRLRLAGVEVRAATALPLQQGAQLKLKVAQLRPIVTLTITNTPQSPEKNLLRTAINRSLPMQRPIGALLNQLESALRPPLEPPPNPSKPESTHQPSITQRHAKEAQVKLPPAVAQAAQKVLQSIPSFGEMRDPQRLPDILRRLGVFSESATQHNLVNNKPELPTQDLKWQLLNLRGTIRKAIRQASPNVPSREPILNSNPGRLNLQLPAVLAAGATTGKQRLSEQVPVAESLRKLGQLVDGAVAKIETNQLKAVSALLDGEYQLALDIPIPFAGGHRDIQLKISREDSNGSDNSATTTTIVLQIPIDEYAILEAVVTLGDESLSVRLWSTDDQLRHSIASMRESLVERLIANGIEKVNVTIGVVKPFNEWGNKLDQLVDVTA